LFRSPPVAHGSAAQYTLSRRAGIGEIPVPVTVLSVRAGTDWPPPEWRRSPPRRSR